MMCIGCTKLEEGLMQLTVAQILLTWPVLLESGRTYNKW